MLGVATLQGGGQRVQSSTECSSDFSFLSLGFCRMVKSKTLTGSGKTYATAPRFGFGRSIKY